MIRLTPRLLTAAAYVRPGHLTADVGTDHAYLPIWLCESGTLTPVPVPDGAPVMKGQPYPASLCAIASDIHQGPVDRAALHVRMAGLADRILTVRTDGLHGLECFSPTDIIIFGMGGELIASILAEAPWTKDPAVRLILQPMTHAEKLRTFLLDNGFAVIGETLSAEESRIYQTICVEYRPKEQPPADARRPACLLTGFAYPDGQRSLHRELIRRMINTHTASRDARASAGLDTDEENRLLDDLAALAAELNPT